MPRKRDLVILPPSRKPYSKYVSGKLGNFYVYGSEQELDLNNTDFMVLDIAVSVLFPLKLMVIYPLSQNESPRTWDVSSLAILLRTLSQNLYV